MLKAPSQYALTSTFLRFQEHYESPKFRGKVFDLEDFMDWYATTRGGKFSYFTDWAGFNFPSHILKSFRTNGFYPMLRKERHLLESLEGIPEPFYVIGVFEPIRMSTVRHEIVHGLFYTDEEYRKKVLECIRTFDTKAFWKILKKIGYSRSVLEDEINAYAVADISTLTEDGLKEKLAKQAKQTLRKVFVDHFGFCIARMEENELLKLVHIKKL